MSKLWQASSPAHACLLTAVYDSPVQHSPALRLYNRGLDLSLRTTVLAAGQVLTCSCWA